MSQTSQDMVLASGVTQPDIDSQHQSLRHTLSESGLQGIVHESDNCFPDVCTSVMTCCKICCLRPRNIAHKCLRSCTICFHLQTATCVAMAICSCSRVLRLTVEPLHLPEDFDCSTQCCSAFSRTQLRGADTDRAHVILQGMPWLNSSNGQGTKCLLSAFAAAGTASYAVMWQNSPMPAVANQGPANAPASDGQTPQSAQGTVLCSLTAFASEASRSLCHIC